MKGWLCRVRWPKRGLQSRRRRDEAILAAVRPAEVVAAETVPGRVRHTAKEDGLGTYGDHSGLHAPDGQRPGVEEPQSCREEMCRVHCAPSRWASPRRRAPHADADAPVRGAPGVYAGGLRLPDRTPLREGLLRLDA